MNEPKNNQFILIAGFMFYIVCFCIVSIFYNGIKVYNIKKIEKYAKVVEQFEDWQNKNFDGKVLSLRNSIYSYRHKGGTSYRDPGYLYMIVEIDGERHEVTSNSRTIQSGDYVRVQRRINNSRGESQCKRCIKRYTLITKDTLARFARDKESLKKIFNKLTKDYVYIIVEE